MAMNLRLSPEAADAVRRASERSGRSQQDIIRTAVARDLGVGSSTIGHDELDQLVATGTVRRPRTPSRRPARRLRLADGMSTADLLDRDDRF